MNARRRFPSLLRSFWPSVLLGGAGSVVLWWLYIWYTLETTSGSWAGLAGVFFTPPVALLGGVAGALLHLAVTWEARAEARRAAEAWDEARERTEGNEARRRARHLAFGAVAVVLFIAITAWSDEAGPALPLTVGVALGVPLGLVGLSLIRPPAGAALGFALAATAGLALVLFGSVLQQASFIVFAQDDLRSHVLVLSARALAAGGLLPLGVLLVLCLNVARTLAPWARRMWRGSGRSHGSGTGLAIGAACAVLWLVMWIPMLASAARERDATQRDRRVTSQQADEAEIVSTTLALERAIGCVEQHVREVPEDAARVDLAHVAASRNGCGGSEVTGRWTLRTEVGRTGDGTRWMLAEPAEPRDLFLYADSSDAVYQTAFYRRADALAAARSRRTEANAPDVPVPPPDGQYLTPFASPVWPLQRLRECIARDLGQLPGRGECQAYRSPEGGFLEMPLERRGATNSSGPVVGRYRVTFAWSGEPSGHRFTLSARPRTFAADGRRSLFVDEDGAVHWTTEDRAATGADPLVPACQTAGGNCVYGRDIR